MLEKIATSYLEKLGYEKVPSGFVVTMRDTDLKLNDANQTLRMIAEQYNALLLDYVTVAPVKLIKEQLAACGIDKSPNAKEELIQFYIETFAINFDDAVEVISETEKVVSKKSKQNKKK